MEKKICVVGGGRWGRNHIRELFQMGCLGGIVEKDAVRLKELADTYPVKAFTSLENALITGFDGYIVATPAETHYEIGKTLIDHGQNVLIEKPMTLQSSQARELASLSDQKKTRLMVGHILLFHPAMRKIKELIVRGRLGQLYYMYSTRLNLGTVRTEENVFWSFAPHDISVMNYLTGSLPVGVCALGGKFLQGTLEDVTVTHLEYPDNIRAHIFVSWLHPFKEQRLVVVGSEGMISFEDSSPDKNIMLYNKRIQMADGIPRKIEQPDEVIPYDRTPPLRKELEYFIEGLDARITVADGWSGAEVVRILEQAQKCLSNAPSAAVINSH